MCSQMERDCRRRIELDLDAADVDAQMKSLKERSLAIHAERTQVSRRIIKAIQASGKPGAAVPVKACGRDWTVGYSDWGGLSVAEVISPDSPLFAQPPVADAVADSPSDDEDVGAVLDPSGNVRVEIEREARRSREAIIRDGTAPDIDPVAGLGSYLRETRYGEPRIPTIRDGKSVAGFHAAEALASIRSALRSDDPITEAAVYAVFEDIDLDADDEHPVRPDDETAGSDEDHAVVEHQAAS